MSNVLSARDIKEELDKRIVGQEALKVRLATLGFIHIVRNLYEEAGHGKFTKRETMLVMGPSGSGKTFSIKTLANILGLPFAHVNAVEITKSGYVGDTLADMLQDKMSLAESNKMIVFIDEFDKISEAHEASSSGNWLKSVQHSILGALEGEQIRTESNGLKAAKTIDTSKMLFILGGAFEELRKERKKVKNNFGLIEVDQQDNFDLTIRNELLNHGMIKEIIGRISVIAETDEVTDEMLKDILLNPYGILEEYKKLLLFYGIKAELEDTDFEELYSIVKSLKKQDASIGARIVDSFVFDKLGYLFYELMNKKETE